MNFYRGYATTACCRDPRARQLKEKEEKKLSAVKLPDGSKLSFKEKMRLFAQEVSFCAFMGVNNAFIITISELLLC